MVLPYGPYGVAPLSPNPTLDSVNLRGWLRRRTPFATAAVSGDSMAPTYRAGDWVLLRRTRRVRPGDVVAVPDPRDPARLLVKRITATRSGGWHVLGDNPAASTDSRHFGPVDPTTVIGKVLLRYHRPG